MYTIEYVPTAWIDSGNYEKIRSDANNWQYAIPLLPGASWLSMPLLPGGRNWSENGQVTNQGPRYDQGISGVVPKLRPAVAQEIMQMERITFLVRGTDRNGQAWLIGDLHAPLSFEAQADTSDENGLNNYRISFQGETALRSPGYVPVF
ncbi:hypothetical protein [Flavilitoribacter nigricans]|uniref:Phage tail protein n=1 Tax=Flavilitoribacter nigricans (strain ATCC 23147 / DSM 23189 / NBRC 102662 / NCIMB 1420 / SS-2) TaxID=1122177 RepID=A0A2D0NEQ5_FLAN2|nr:hypothetical protein [Flavilitoribacter nigricans]PHN06957.1 hypothetical protein CRP01_09075 [Flavilitoribacter nigricans DSM 23189 = NBRC 102662]